MIHVNKQGEYFVCPDRELSKKLREKNGYLS